MCVFVCTGQGHHALLRAFLRGEWPSHSNLQAEEGGPQESFHGVVCQALQPTALLTPPHPPQRQVAASCGCGSC